MCNYSCNKTCPKLLKSTAVAVTGTAANQVLTITVPTTVFENLENYCLIICQNIPTGITIPVVIANGTQTIPVMCKKGNTLHADQIKSRRRYSITYGNAPVHIMVNDCVPKTGYAV